MFHGIDIDENIYRTKIRQALIIVVIILAMGLIACNPAPTPTLVPLTATIPPRPATAIATSVPPTQPRLNATPTLASNTRTDIIEFVVILSSDDTVAVVDDVEKLDGVKSAQSSGQAIQVTYDPSKVTLQKIIAAIENYGVPVKK